MKKLWNILATVLPWLGWILLVLSFLQRNPPPTNPRILDAGETTNAVLHGR